METGDILLVQLSMVETYFFHITKSMQQNSALQSISIFIQFMKYCNKFPVFWLYVHTLPGTGWAMLHNNITKSDFLLAFFFYLLKTQWCNSIIQMEKEEEKFSLPKHWVITSYHMPYQLDTFAFLFLGSSEVGELRFLLIGILK